MVAANVAWRGVIAKGRKVLAANIQLAPRIGWISRMARPDRVRPYVGRAGYRPPPLRNIDQSSQMPAADAPAKPRKAKTGRPNKVGPPLTVMEMDNPTIRVTAFGLQLVTSKFVVTPSLDAIKGQFTIMGADAIG
jgi:hypothetical protein